MPKAIRMHATGGPEVLHWDDVDPGRPAAGEVLLRHTAVGLNYIDTYHRSGLYPVPNLPATIGMEGAGVVEEIGSDVAGLKAGDRVAYSSAIGAYSEVRRIGASAVVKIPSTVTDQQAAAIMLKGMTAQYLVRRTYQVKPGDTILVHAAAGGVGLILCQWAAHLGATVIGTVSSDAKAELARAHGCHHTIIYTRENFVEKVKVITGGAGVPVVYDSTGKDNFQGSLECLRALGLMVSYGNASGPVPPFSLLALAPKSLFLTRPKLFDYISTRESLEATAADLFDVVARGIVKVQINQTYPLQDAAQAHRDLEARKTTGSTVLIP